MSEKYKFFDPGGLYFTTTTIVGWADVFTRPEMKDIIVDSLRYCILKKGLIIHAWCLMPSHLHMLCSTSGPLLENTLRDFKNFTSKAIVEFAKTPYESRREWMLELFHNAGKDLRRITNFKVWQDGNHPILLTKSKITRQKLDYIHDNPVVAGIVTEPDHYLHSSAKDYYGTGKGLLPIEFIDLYIT